MRLREKKNWLMQRGESPPQTLCMASMGTRPSKVLWEQGRDMLFLHPLLWQLQTSQGEGTMAHITLLTGRCRCSHRKPVAWDWEQPHQLCSVAQSFPSPHLTCAAWGREDESYKPLVRTKYPLVSDLSEIQLGLIAGVPNPFCISDEKKGVSTWMNVTYSWVYGP